MKVEAKQVVAALDAAIEDQRRHVVDFEEDYEADRVKLQYDPKLSDPQRKKKMSALTKNREKDVQRIFTKEQFMKWLGRDAEGMVRPLRSSSALSS